jgi:hypothetical protein
MRIEAVYDDAGSIMAAIIVPSEDESYPRPVPSETQSVGKFEVPDELADTPLDVICTTFRVDTNRGRLAPFDMTEST